MGNALKPCRQQHASFVYEPLINHPISEEAENENMRVFSIKELKKATNKFRKDRVVTRDNGSVQTFYKRKSYVDDTTFAPSRTKSGIAVSVMEFHSDSPQELQVWKEEVKSLEKIVHPNFVRFFGYCCEDNRLLLVFEHLHNGSLDQHIFGKEEALPWEIRIKIAIGIAQGLAFLHSIKKTSIHRELRMHNIMLDEQYNAKLFFLEANKQLLGNERAFGEEAIYVPPEYLSTGRWGRKHDVYTFGVILFELLTGSKDRAKKLYMPPLDGRISPFVVREVIDPRLGTDYSVIAAIDMGTLIRSCTRLDRKKRPLMQRVLEILN